MSDTKRDETSYPWSAVATPTDNPLADRLRDARARSRARHVALARIPTLGAALALALGTLGCVLLLLLVESPFDWKIPAVLCAGSLGALAASRWVERAPGTAGEVGNAITLLVTVVTVSMAPPSIGLPIGIAALTLVIASGTISARPGSIYWIPITLAAWWFLLWMHPPPLADLISVAVFPALLLGATGLLIALSRSSQEQHDLLNQDSLAGLLQMSEQLEIERQRAVHASHTKSVFLTNMSHELRTPLNAIIGYSELILEDPAALEVEDVERIEHAGRHLLALVNDVLDMSRIEAGALKLESRPVALPELLDEVHQMTRALTEPKGLALRWTVSDTVPATLPGDALRLRQILLNLVGNAVKFTDVGQVAVDVEATQQQLVARVSDTGPGIEPELLAQIFEPFIQGDSQGLRNAGSGLGLPIARQLALAMGGDIVIDSSPGRGSTFSLAIPLPSG